MDHILSRAIPLVSVYWHNWTVDGKLLKVGTAMTIELRVEVREYSALKERVVAEVDPTNNMSRLELPEFRHANTKQALLELTMICSVSAK